ncbi:MAG: hypothetical protein AAB316_07295 [Bacteroidota bacterium]
MKNIKFFFLASLLLATAALQAQDEVATSEWQPPQIAQRGTLGVAGLSMGFAAEWKVTEGGNALIGTSPDGQVTIASFIANGHDVQEVVDNLQTELDRSFEGLVLSPVEPYELNGLQLKKTTGSGKMKDENHFTMEVHIDILETPVDGDNAIVLVVTYGAEETITQYFDEILLTLNSFTKI